MAFRGETGATLAGVVELRAETVAETPRVVAAADARRVRIAIGAMVFLAAIDLALYLPRLL